MKLSDISPTTTKGAMRVSDLGKVKPEKPKAAPTRDSGLHAILDKLHHAIFLSPAESDRLKAEYKADPTKFDPFNGGEIIRQIGKDAGTSLRDIASDVRHSPVVDLLRGDKSGFLQDVLSLPSAPGKAGVDLLGLAASPVTGTATSVIGRPIEALTGVRREIPGMIATMAIPGGGEVRAAKAARDVTELGEAEGYGGAVKSLLDEGVDLTAGQRRGGRIRRIEEAQRSNPYIGHAIRKAETRARESFNRAIYNRVLKPVGETASDKIPVGRKGVAHVGDRISAHYEVLKPQLKLIPDDTFVDGVSDVRNRVGRLPETQEKQFETIFNDVVLRRLNSNEIDGQTFKEMESELSKEARDRQGSPDVETRKLSRALEEVTGLLRDNLERSSSPAVRDRLKAVNTSWAMLTRLENAASRRAGSGGVFSTGDLLSAVRSMDKSVRHRSFARGDALLQDLAEQAHEVMTSRLPDSGTAERLMVNNPQGLKRTLLSYGTNPLASMWLDAAKKAPKGTPAVSVPKYPLLPLLANATSNSQ